jgi:hypothetical protein
VFLGGIPTDPPGVALLGPSYTIVPSSASKSALSTTARRAKRENGGLGEDPPGRSHGGAPFAKAPSYPAELAKRAIS